MKFIFDWTNQSAPNNTEQFKSSGRLGMHKGIPEDIEQHIVQYIPLARQVRLKREMIIKLNHIFLKYQA